MRLWSLHPKYLDSKGLIALWRESLLAQSVLLKGKYTECSLCEGIGIVEDISAVVPYPTQCPKCKGTGKIKTPYYNHPQLIRFKETLNENAINIYLYHIWYEANKRGYKFNHSKIPQIDVIEQIKDLEHNKLTVTKGQLEFEWIHLGKKLYNRDRLKLNNNISICWETSMIETNPLFKVIEGDIESWEKII